MQIIMAMMEVEKVLEKYPIEYRRNYYTNRESLTVVQKGMELVDGTYDNEDNIIEFSNTDALIHELFHMSFRDQDKANKKLFEDEEIYYGNGVSIKVPGNEMPKKNHGVTEGFCEYLCKKIKNKKSTFNYYFVDLLISIYSEEILKYPFTNDPIGFFTDQRFYDISEFCHSLDGIQNSSDGILLISRLSIFKEILKDNTHENREDVLKMMGNTMIEYKESIISAFKCIINEYNNCNNSNIDRETFINKLNLFLSNKDYITAFALDDDKKNVKKEIEKLIEEFSTNKTKKICKL